MLRRVRATGGKVAGVLWYQGESEAFPAAVSEFQPKFENFIAAIRSDFGEPRLPFYYVQIGRFVTTEGRRLDEAWNQVQELQRKAEMDLARSGMVAAVDAGLDDSIHLNTAGLKRVGHRLANLACHDVFPDVASCRGLKPGPRPASITVRRNAVRDEYLMRVKFSGVNGGLKSEGRLAGFSVHSPDGKAMPVIFKAAIDPEDPTVVLLYYHVRYAFETDELPRGATLRYGYGKDPYCNLTDEADMAVPVFTMAIP
jgi:sialate O-acetylesterase